MKKILKLIIAFLMAALTVALLAVIIMALLQFLNYLMETFGGLTVGYYRDLQGRTMIAIFVAMYLILIVVGMALDSNFSVDLFEEGQNSTQDLLKTIVIYFILATVSLAILALIRKISVL